MLLLMLSRWLLVIQFLKRDIISYFRQLLISLCREISLIQFINHLFLGLVVFKRLYLF
jgi:hypothetical protein